MTLTDWGTVAVIAATIGGALVWLGRSIVKQLSSSIGDVVRPDLRAMAENLSRHTIEEERRFGHIERALALLAGRAGVDLRDGAP